MVCRRVWGVGMGVPVSTGEGVWGGNRAPYPEFFLSFYLKMVSFGAFWVALPRCMVFRATVQESEAQEEALVKDDILH